jgi:hypothetical protein
MTTDDPLELVIEGRQQPEAWPIDVDRPTSRTSTDLLQAQWPDRSTVIRQT